MAKAKLKFSADANRRAKDLAGEYAANLRGVAGHIASQQRAAQVSEANVDSAFESIAKAGLSRRRWTERPESLTGLGAFLFALAFSCPDAAATLFTKTSHRDAIATGLLVALAVLGAVFAVYGWVLARWPAPPAKQLTWRQWVWRIVYWLLIVVGLFFAGNVLVQRVIYECDDCAMDTSEAPAQPEDVSFEDLSDE